MCRFKEYDLTFALFAKAPSWGLAARGGHFSSAIRNTLISSYYRTTYIYQRQQQQQQQHHQQQQAQEQCFDVQYSLLRSPYPSSFHLHSRIVCRVCHFLKQQSGQPLYAPRRPPQLVRMSRLHSVPFTWSRLRTRWWLWIIIHPWRICGCRQGHLIQSTDAGKHDCICRLTSYRRD